MKELGFRQPATKARNFFVFAILSPIARGCDNTHPTNSIIQAQVGSSINTSDVTAGAAVSRDQLGVRVHDIALALFLRERFSFFQSAVGYIVPI